MAGFVTNEARNRAYRAGWDAYYDSKSKEDCPHDDLPMAEEWLDGWQSAHDTDHYHEIQHEWLMQQAGEA